MSDLKEGFRFLFSLIRSNFVLSFSLPFKFVRMWMLFLFEFPGSKKSAGFRSHFRSESTPSARESKRDGKGQIYPGK